MAKQTISAKEAVADIRSGMDDAALMHKYHVAPDGLQSLFDKLVLGGFIDISELDGRLPGLLGTVNLSETIAVGTYRGPEGGAQPLKERSTANVAVQEAARDIRSGMDDVALMKKYKLSSKGLQSLFNKLMAFGAITQADIERRSVAFDHTVSLREEFLSFTDIMKQYEPRSAKPPVASPNHEPAQSPRVTIIPALRKVKAPEQRAPARVQIPKAQIRVAETSVSQDSWYDNALVVVLLLVSVFPLGFYGLYRNTTLTAGIKVALLITWIILICLLFWLLVFDMGMLSRAGGMDSIL